MNSIVTQDQRDLLETDEEEREVSDSGVRMAYSRICDRLQAAIQDFETLHTHFPDAQFENAFKELTITDRGGITAGLSILYRAAKTLERREGTERDLFASMLTRAIQWAEFDPEGPLPHSGYITVKFEGGSIIVDKAPPESLDFDHIVEKVKAGEIGDLTEAEKTAYIQFMHQEGKLDPEYPQRAYERTVGALGSEREGAREEVPDEVAAAFDDDLWQEDE
jgi:hypothetical protein